MSRIRWSWVAAACLVLMGSGATARGQTPGRFSQMPNADAWKQIRGPDQALPAWALELAESLPRTTGAMLGLNYLHRAKNPIGQVLAGKLHLIAADAIHSDYALRYAEADLVRAGLKEEEIKLLLGDASHLPRADRLAVVFARKMTRAAYSVTDEEMAELVEEFGAEKVVGMVHTLAWINFQNRIVLALGVQVEPGGPLPPLDPHLDPAQQAKVVTPARPPWDEARPDSDAPAGEKPEWRKISDAEIQAAVENQKARKPRVPLPDASRLAQLPEEIKKRTGKVVWTQVSAGYQPLLTKTWLDMLRVYQEESRLSGSFSNSFFWVITRGNECFY